MFIHMSQHVNRYINFGSWLRSHGAMYRPALRVLAMILAYMVLVYAMVLAHGVRRAVGCAARSRPTNESARAAARGTVARSRARSIKRINTYIAANIF
jgi:hypothetical protein